MKIATVIFKHMLAESNARGESFTIEEFNRSDFQKDVVDFMTLVLKDYAQSKCLEQRGLCAEHAKGIYKDYPPSKESIINSPEPNFD